jgi:hypothetical protein
VDRSTSTGGTLTHRLAGAAVLNHYGDIAHPSRRARDLIAEGTETATFSIKASAAHDLGTPAATTINIADNDGLTINPRPGGRPRRRLGEPSRIPKQIT